MTPFAEAMALLRTVQDEIDAQEVHISSAYELYEFLKHHQGDEGNELAEVLEHREVEAASMALQIHDLKAEVERLTNAVRWWRSQV